MSNLTVKNDTPLTNEQGKEMIKKLKEYGVNIPEKDSKRFLELLEKYKEEGEGE